MTLFTFIEILGTLAFAISGIRLASAKRFDWFGAYVVGFTTAIGGGTVRDLMLSLTPFWMLDSTYLFVTAGALLIVIVSGPYLIRFNNTFFIFDAIGLGLFTVVGIEKTLAAGFPLWVGIIMGTITGAAGGVLRDILINEEPLISGRNLRPRLRLRRGRLRIVPVGGARGRDYGGGYRLERYRRTRRRRAFRAQAADSEIAASDFTRYIRFSSRHSERSGESDSVNPDASARCFATLNMTIRKALQTHSEIDSC